MGGPSYSFTAHGPDEFLNMTGASLALKVAEAGFVVAITHYCRVQLTLAAGMRHWDKIHIIGCGVDTSEFALSRTVFTDDAPFVVVGRLCPQKAQVLITRAVAQLVPKYPHLKVIFVGDGESRADVEREIAHHNLEQVITLKGWQSNTEVRSILSSARVLLLPSFAEGLPVGIMESFALGRPVISTFIAGIPELVDDHSGWIIPAGSVDHIAMAMEQVINASADELAHKGQVGRNRVEERHDIHKNVSQLLALIKGGRHGPV